MSTIHPSAVHGTLTPGVVTTVNVSTSGRPFEIINRSMTGTIWYRVDGEDPVDSGDDTYILMSACRLTMHNRPSVEVRLLSGEALDYSVQGRSK